MLWNGQLKVTSGGAQHGKDPSSEILFFGTADLSRSCKTRPDGGLTDEVVSCKKTQSSQKRVALLASHLANNAQVLSRR